MDTTYHASVEDMLSQQQRQQQEAEAAGGGRKKGKKRGITLHVDELHTLYAAQVIHFLRTSSRMSEGVFDGAVLQGLLACLYRCA